VDHEQLIALHGHGRHLGTGAGEILHEHVDELELLVLVEHIGQPVGRQADIPREEAVLGIGDEFHLRRRWRLRLERRRRVGVRLSAEHDPEPATELCHEVRCHRR